MESKDNHVILPSGSILLPPPRSPQPPSATQPHSQVHRPVLLVYFPGASVSPENYIAYAQATQTAAHAHGIPLCVCIVKYPMNWLVPLLWGSGILLRAAQLERLLSTAVKELHVFLEDSGSDSDAAAMNSTRSRFEYMLLSGHSLGAVHAQTLIARLNSNASSQRQQEQTSAGTAKGSGSGGSIRELPELIGLLCLGSYLVTNQGLPSVPVATILGDRDGLVKLTQFSNVYSWMVEQISDASVRAKRAPLAILHGVSHTSFSDGATTSYVSKHDLPPTLSTPLATAALAKMSADFIKMTLPSAEPSVAETLREAFQQREEDAAASYLKPWGDALHADASGATTTTAQRVLLGLSNCDEFGHACGLDGQPNPPAGGGAVGLKDASMPPPAVDSPYLNLNCTQPPADPGKVTVLRACTWNTTPSNTRNSMPFLFSKPRIFCQSNGNGGVDTGSSTEAQSSGAPVDTVSAPLDAIEVWPQGSLAEAKPFAMWGSVPAAPTKLRCKLKTRAQVALALESGEGVSAGTADYDSATAAQSGTMLTPATDSTAAEVQKNTTDKTDDACKDLDPSTAAKLNEGILQSVLHTLPEASQQLYLRSPRRLKFTEDERYTAPPYWAAASLKFEDMLGDAESASGKRKVVGVQVQSPCAATSPGPGRFNGMFYCTLLSKAQAFEYILYGSQRGAGIAEISVEDVDATVQVGQSAPGQGSLELKAA